MENVTQAGHLLSLETSLGKDVLILTHFIAEESISSLFNYKLEMFSNQSDIDPKKLIGKPVSIQIKKDTNPRYFHGIINRFYAGTMRFPNGRYYRAEVVPSLWFLTCANDSRIYQNKSTNDIIFDVFKRLGLNDYSTQFLKKNQQQRRYCVQYHESSFNFVSRLMEEEGIFYFFKHEKNKHTLILADSASVFEEITGHDISYITGSFPDDCISAWEHQHNFDTGKQTHGYYDFERPSTKIQKTSSTLVGISNMSNYENFVFTGTYDATRGDENKAKLYMDSQDAHHEIAEGKSSYTYFELGKKFTITFPFETALSAEKKSYIFTQITHEVIDTTYSAYETSGQQYSNTFTVVPAAVVYRPPITTPKPRIFGLQTAVVVGPPGEEICTDEYGRIKAQFHWDRIGQHDDKSSCWIRVAHTWSGNHWGTQFIPRVGQEVVISFLDGDPDQPLVIGCVYNANQKLPYSLPANSTQSGIKSHSSKGGAENEANELRFEDKKGQELFFMHAQKDFSRVVEHDDTLQVKNNQTITIQKQREITVTEGNETTTIKKGKRTAIIETGDDIKTVKTGNYQAEITAGKSKMKAGQAIELTVGSSQIKMDPTSITLQAGPNSIKIDPSGVTVHGLTVNVKADTSLKIEGVITEVDGNGMLTLKGAITMIN